jgi:NAD(P)-dependent dehydrogenase (short-subunit alcohol dehydrogenase family)
MPRGSNGSIEHQRTESHPKPPFPEKKLEKPGLETELEPKPRYEAPTYKAAGKLDGRRALITGGDSGIGRAVAVIFAREGADVAINYLPDEQEDAEETKRAVEAVGKRCILLPGDLVDPALCKSLVKDTVAKLGGLDILVSNAAHQNRKTLDEITLEEFDRTMKTNVYAYYHLAQAAVPHMKPGSAIIATSSSTGYRASEELPDYSATKGAARRQGHPRQRGRARSGVDAAEPGRRRAVAGRCLEVRREDADGAPGTTRGGRARVRLPRVRSGLQLHHRHHSARARWRNDRRLADLANVER